MMSEGAGYVVVGSGAAGSSSNKSSFSSVSITGVMHSAILSSMVFMIDVFCDKNSSMFFCVMKMRSRCTV